MKSTADKVILIFSELILIDLLIIANVFIANGIKGKAEDTAVPPPKTGFAELIAQDAIQPQVLSTTAEATPEPPPIKRPSKESYTVAIIGDSMAETMGDSIDYVKASLMKKYPGTNFAMYNYGIGAENVTSALARFDMPFDHGTRHYAPIPELKPDILIVGSYAYNPLDPFDKNQHAAQLSVLVNLARRVAGKVYMLAEIAPVENGFGTGPGGVNWPEELADAQVQKINLQMENVFAVANQLNVPAIDVYNKSQRTNSIYGKVDYVSTHDHIHPSLLGQTFTADIIADALNLN